MDDLLNHAPCGFVTFADDGTIHLANATFAHLLSHEPGALTGRPLQSLLSPGGRIFYQTHFFPLLKMHGKAEEIYFSMRAQNGQDVPVLANAVRREGGDAPNHCIFVAIQQRNRYEDELLQAKKAAEADSRAKAKFLSVISHELRTPLSVITGFSDILIRGMRGPLSEDQLSDLQRIKNAGQYQMTLVNDILNYARLEAGHVSVNVETVPVDPVIARAESLLSLKFREAGLEYVHEKQAGIAVCADPQRLQQILLNLLTNAVKFTASGGHIGVISERGDGTAHIHVRDTGCGILPEYFARIFDPFVQVDAEKTEANRRGVGLGLAISRDLARAMSGDLTVQSAPGQGSVFTLTLPLIAN